ncbi:ras guanine nucleotide exchange factor domain-containing protein [Coniella lustricola]|uniref:Ras guanine nucleotide exchange factor domain-containing protein n=1 Tax=Coniella lustricola TaxID=2025994 RepID=A0A2T3A3H4_9PEZI|nr:ras guanine nucleotide exchange factor domain-containing protein [Coniella lustricola]
MNATSGAPFNRDGAHTIITMDTIIIAVIGANGVGKSAFMQRALKLSQPPNHGVNFNWTEADGTQHSVHTFEVDLEAFDLEMNEPIRWPRQANGQMTPRVDGTMVLYDVTSKESIKLLPQTLSSLSVSGYTTFLVATKCDTTEDVREVDTASISAAFPSVAASFCTSVNAPSSQRECLQAMLRTLVGNHRKGDDNGNSRRRAASSAAPEPLTDSLNNGRPDSQHSRHSRASSDLSMLKGFPSGSNETYYRTSMARSPRSFAGGNNGNEAMNQTVSTQLRQTGTRLDIGDDESDVDSFHTSITEDLPVLQRADENFMERQAKSTGVTFEELVDRLLAPRMTRADQNFADVFLCLYRKFAPPKKLFAAILTRLERAKDDKSAHYLIKKATQMRIIEVVARWVTLYPGDFARAPTKKTLERFITHLATEPAFLAAASMMRAQLESAVVEDDDTGWAQADEAPSEDDSGETAPEFKELELTLGGSMDSLKIHDPAESGEVRRPSAVSDLSSHGGERDLGHGEHTYQYFTYEDYEREAATMVPKATIPLNKMRYVIFMDLSADELAEEITRIDWIMFSSVRIRDWVRHVSLSSSEKEKCRSLKNANRLISHFNHVAKWVQNMILIRDKAKHRIPCLEKFMVIAQKLRKLNNYNGLGAIVAGLQNANIARLRVTMSGVRPEIGKQYQSAEMLMLQAKSSFAYRLAWENSPLPRIPYMALHRKDLTAAEEGNKTLVGPNGDRINWRKFEILGEILLPIMKSQGAPYANLTKQHQLCRELILDCRMELDEDALYQRSKTVEPGPGATSSSTSDLRKKTIGLFKGG